MKVKVQRKRYSMSSRSLKNEQVLDQATINLAKLFKLPIDDTNLEVRANGLS